MVCFHTLCGRGRGLRLFTTSSGCLTWSVLACKEIKTGATNNETTNNWGALASCDFTVGRSGSGTSFKGIQVLPRHVYLLSPLVVCCNQRNQQVGLLNQKTRSKCEGAIRCANGRVQLCHEEVGSSKQKCFSLRFGFNL